MKLRIAAAISLVLGATNAAIADSFRTVALTGEPAPGTPAGVIFSNLFYAVINEHGETAFNGGITGPGVIHVNPGTNTGIWAEDGGSLRKVARAGDAAFGAPAGINYGLQSVPKIDAAGGTTFLADVPGPNGDGVYSEGEGSLRLVARQGDQAPGAAMGVQFSKISLVPLLNNDGRIAFTSFVAGPGIVGLAEGLWSDRAGTLELVIREGSAAPGISGATITQLNPPFLNDLGEIAFSARFSGSPFPNDHAIWTEQSGSFSIIARSGQAPLAASPGAVFSRVTNPHINNAGQLMFYGELTGPGVGAASDSALWKYDGGVTSLVAHEGSAAVGAPSGVSYGAFLNTWFNGAGEATFAATLAGAGVTAQNDSGLWSVRNGELTLIAREGDQAPGALPGVLFGDLANLGSSLGMQVNSASQIAFEVPLTGPGITSANDSSIWSTDLNGALRLVAREGALFDVNDDPTVDDSRTVWLSRLSPFGGGGEDGESSSFNDSGQLVITLNFTDSSAGVFVVDTTIPEPRAASLLAAAATVCCGRRKIRA